LGGFASGTVGGIRTRRYHALLLSSATPPANRFVLVNGLEVFVKTPTGTFPLSSQRYDGQVVHPEGFRNIHSFAREPWPTWIYELPDKTRIEHGLLMGREVPSVGVYWKLLNGQSHDVKLMVRPLLSGRDYHQLHHENSNFNFESEAIGAS